MEVYRSEPFDIAVGHLGSRAGLDKIDLIAEVGFGSSRKIWLKNLRLTRFMMFMCLYEF